METLGCSCHRRRKIKRDSNIYTRIIAFKNSMGVAQKEQVGRPKT
jgi:hypothetical protein